ncbi:MAG: phosphatase PAP2 family protein [Xanthomonadales bacterium PRO7]|nr:phosphatase PAP2 family protein [Xanthomonadales bacterium PRO7]HMM56586.1 phosphatase PAP2 family protein [Rudaea sp.]
MSKRALAITALVCAALALISIFGFDRRIAEAVHASVVAGSAVFVEGTRALDAVSGRSLLHSHALSGVLLGGILLALGALIWLLNRGSYLARALIFTGGVQLATIVSAFGLKEVFGRQRPFELLGHGDWQHMWFAGGNSFPSGHNAFFWGLFLPLMYLFPRWRVPLLLIPLFIALARIDTSFHFLSDVLASITLACLVTLIAATLCARWIRPVGAR